MPKSSTRIVRWKPLMKKAKPCITCGEKTMGLLFNDTWLGIPLCSRKCETEYLNALTPIKREQIDRVRHINDLINATKRHETICWAISGIGLLMIVAAFLLTQTVLFLVGVIPLTVGAISISYFEKQLSQLTSRKRQIVI